MPRKRGTLFMTGDNKTGFNYSTINGNESGGLAEIFSRLKSSADDDRIVNVERYWRNGYDGNVERCYEYSAASFDALQYSFKGKRYASVPSVRLLRRTTPAWALCGADDSGLEDCACCAVKNIGKPCAGTRHARCDEGGPVQLAGSLLTPIRFPLQHPHPRRCSGSGERCGVQA